ncbi:uncharacterized protein EV420DRAFT_765756 [Desarmillaria tabescens]|uniref:Heterokaryon incompatibility domain-containing protein n=1 Tax=Armillaria tabescens TaxID=1929756 RepID=A0AA39JXT6_ARMTA|nr:uncharacterized protein EV420DRAFT_765756 [Desarmillaria tabescens]KAK0449805.1 hypothetical protein EV420DRAFT_765756 [Desarmillaria tabescens]
MGNTPSKVLYQWLFGGMMSIWNYIYSVFSTARTTKDSSPGRSSELDKNHDTTVPSEPQEQHGSSIPEDAGPVLKATPDLSLRSHPELPSIAGSQTSPKEEQSSGEASVDSDASPDKPWRQPKGISLPEVTISALTETGLAESSIVVPLQRSYTVKARVISSRLADTPCTTLGVQGLLDLLNTTLGTSYAQDSPSLSSLLEDCIANNYDFGMAYGRLRRIWYTCNDWRTVRGTFHRWEKEDREMRQKALDGNRIVKPYLPPRRVWDLYSNRVVPWWCIGLSLDSDRKSGPWLLPISHAWMEEKDRFDAQTPINGYEWPVPIPKDANLNLIRIEMLNLGAQYAWLDVLCLRQEGGPREDMRLKEWKLDVPTIGAVYHDGHVVCYLSGLGRPLTLKEGDLDSDRSWFRRAWTLQEVGKDRQVAGDTLDGPLHAKPVDEDGNYETELLTRFHKQWRCTGSLLRGMFAILKDMQNRVSTNPVDKVAGLAFELQSMTIPAYCESQSLEEAWTALVDSLDGGSRGRLFISYPEPGNAGTKWWPSWDQVMTKSLPIDDIPGIGVDWDEMKEEDWCDAHCIEKGLVRGLAVVEGGDRRGELIIKDKDGREHKFKIMADHTYPIPDDTYTLISADLLWSRSHHWVVGRTLPGKRFEKVSVLEFLDEKEQKRSEDLHITKKCRYILV